VFILGDLAAFALLFGVWMYYREGAALFATPSSRCTAASERSTRCCAHQLAVCDHPPFAPVRAQMRRVAQRDRVRARLRVGFLLDKVLEWTDLVANGHGPTANNYFLYFFVLTGLHAFHVLIGMGILSALLRSSRKPSLSKGQFAFVEVVPASGTWSISSGSYCSHCCT